MKSWITSGLVLAVVIMPWPPAAQAGFDFHPVFRILDVPSGLPDQNVEAIVQDIHGYVWIATRGGLLRHEGHELRLFPRDPRLPHALPNNNITTLHAHSDGMVWAGVTDAGAVEMGPDFLPRRRLAPESEGGVLPHGQIWSMVEDCEGRLWIAFMRGGVARFDPQTEELLTLPQQEEYGLAPDTFQLDLAVDDQCRLWLAQFHRVSVLNWEGDRPRFTKVLGAGPNPRGLIFNVFRHRELGMLATRVNVILSLSQNKDAPTGWEKRELARLAGVVLGLAELPDGRLVATTTDGLFFIDPVSGDLERIGGRPDLPDALSQSSMQGALTVDREGGVWAAAAGNGLVYLPPERAAFPRLHRGSQAGPNAILDRVQVVSPTFDGQRFWVAARDGLQRLDPATSRIDDVRDLFPSFPSDLPDTRRVSVIERADGLLMLDLARLWWLQPDVEPQGPLLHRADLDNTSFAFLHPDGPESVWVGTSSIGLLHYDLHSAELRRYGPNQPHPRTLPETAPVQMIRDAADQIILAGVQTLYRFNREQGFVPVASIDLGRITDLAFAPDGSLWIAKDAGLSRWRWSTEGAEHIKDYDISSAVERVSLRRVFPARDDEIWLVLSSGVARLDPQTGHTRLFTRSDGLAPDEFTAAGSKMLPDGRLVMGGNRGLVFVDPARVQHDIIKPPVYLTRVRAGDAEHVLVPGYRPPLRLDWNENAVRFDFSALTFIAPERVRYRVRLHGWDDDWVELGRLGQMYYSNLRSGSYRFEVQAATRPGLWTETGDSVVIELAPPPWASPPAFAAYAAFLILAVGAGWRGARQTRQRRRHLQEVQQKRDLAEGQRKLLERLNADLEPIPLAHAIVAEVQQLTNARRVSFGYVHEQMPRRLVTNGDEPVPSRQEWLAQIQQVDNHSTQLVELKADREMVARVVLQAPAEGFRTDHEQRLALLVDLAEQSLHNSLLLERVKRLAERAEAANHAKSEFLATMSHEIRTPLHGVLGMADLIHEVETDPDKIDLIETLRASGRQLQRIIDDVLDISRIEAGRLGLKKEPFELVSLLEHVIDLHAPTAARKQLDMRLRIQSDLPTLVWGDPDRLAQILGNLINNAVKFTEHGGIELAAGLDRDFNLILDVKDSGPGIAPSQQPQLFQPFSQLDGSTTRSHGGSGLGLAICKRLAESMGGTLGLLPSRRWPGSTFRLCLPGTQPPRRTPPTAMLDQVDVVALLDAPSYRVVHRLARRWAFRLHNGWRRRPVPGALLLLQTNSMNDDPRVSAWLDAAHQAWCLESPYARRAGPHSTPLAKLRFLRWPLQEGRLVAALIDHVLERRA